VSAIVEDGTHILANRIGTDKVDRCNTGGKPWKRAVASSNGLYLLISNEHGAHGFESDALRFHHFSAEPVTPVQVTDEGVAIFLEGTSRVVQVAMRASRTNTKHFKRRVTQTPSPVAAIDTADGMTWILCECGDICVFGNSLNVAPMALDPTITPIGVIACRDGRRAFIAGAMGRTRSLVFAKCRIDLELGRVVIEPQAIDTKHVWTGEPAVASHGCIALMCRDKTNPDKPPIIVTAGQYNNDVFVGQNEIESKDMVEQLEGPVETFRIEAVYHCPQMISIVWSANDRLIGIMTLGKEHSKVVGDTMDSIVFMKYCLLTVDPVDIDSVVVTTAPISTGSMNDVSREGVGITLVSSYVSDAMCDIANKRADIAAGLLRRNAMPQTGSAFTTGAVMQTTMQLEEEKRKAEKLRAENDKLQKQLSDSRVAVEAAGKSQKTMAEELSRATAANKTTKGELRTAQKKLRQLVASSDRVQQELQKLRQEREAREAQHREEAVREQEREAAIDDLKKKAERARAEAEALREQLSAARHSRARETEAATERHRQEVSRLRKTYAYRKDSIAADMDALRAKHAASVEEHSAKLEGLAAKVSQRDAEVKDLAAKVSQRDAEVAKLREAGANPLGTEQAGLKRHIADAQAQRVVQEKLIAGLKRENAGLQIGNRQMHERIAFWDQVLNYGYMPDGTPLATGIEQLPQLAIFQQQIAALELQVQALVAQLAAAKTGDIPVGKDAPHAPEKGVAVV
jgi:hypothetical protein